MPLIKREIMGTSYEQASVTSVFLCGKTIRVQRWISLTDLSFGQVCTINPSMRFATIDFLASLTVKALDSPLFS